MSERSYLSIGEVLALLRDEFADITISKIRFLESQGLIDPERTPSGYRKFYEPDVERLRWILRQQREHYLPLRVIKDKLVQESPDDPGGGRSASPVAVEDRPRPASAGQEPEAVERRPAEPTRLDLNAAAEPASARPARSPSQGRPVDRPLPEVPPLPEAELDVPVTGRTLSTDELTAATGLTPSQLNELIRFGLVTGRKAAGSVFFDEDALAVASVAAGFFRFGIEARHLRTYKTAAEREAGVFEQLVMPLLKQRNPQSREQAMANLTELTRLGHGLRAALLRGALREYL